MSADSPLAIHGPYFWKNGSRFLVRGIVYQPDFGQEPSPSQVTIDPITDDRLPRLEHDIALLKELGVNTIFVYTIDTMKSHTQAMKMLLEARIYVLTTISTPSQYISRLAPYESYNADTMKSFFTTIDAMANYSNTLGILVADQLIQDNDTMPCVPVISAIIRDLKKYMKLMNESRGQRYLPVGYGMGAVEAREIEILNYLSSGAETDRIDFSTCKCYLAGNNRSIEASGFSDLVGRIQNTKIPIFLSEYSHATRQTRSFIETRALLSPPMTKIFSGGCAYEFWQSANGYGLARMLPGTDKDVPSTRPAASQLGDNSDSGSRSGPHDKEISETRRTAWGTLDIYQDFFNYQKTLSATETVLHKTDYADSEMVAERSATRLETRFPATFDHRGQILESCISWAGLERDYLDSRG